MKKWGILATSIVMIGVLLVSGSVALAKGGEDNPVDQWGVLIEKVNQIYDILVGADFEEANTTLTSIENKVDTLSTVKIESGEGSYEVAEGEGSTWRIMEVDSTQVGHVTLTAAGFRFGPDDKLFIRLYLPSLGPIIMVLDGDGPTQTVEFAASHWALDITGDGPTGTGPMSQGTSASYAYTITYPSSSE